MNGLSIVICTRNRPADLEKCINSVINAKQSLEKKIYEIIVIDDGDLSDELLNVFATLGNEHGYQFKYIKKVSNYGLFQSRIIGIENSSGEVILFLDDDVEIESDYLLKLEDSYKSNFELAGVGGIDTVLRATWFYRMYCRLFFISSWKPGKLSVSGSCNSSVDWVYKSKPFFSEFLIGHNMSFKRKYLKKIKVSSCFDGYSIGEDVFISFQMNHYGSLLVNPSLRVKHNISKLSRDRITKTKISSIVSRFHFFEYYHTQLWSYLAFMWNILGLIFLNFLRYKKYGTVKGYFKGLKIYFKLLFLKFFKTSLINNQNISNF